MSETKQEKLPHHQDRARKGQDVCLLWCQAVGQHPQSSFWHPGAGSEAPVSLPFAHHHRQPWVGLLAQLRHQLPPPTPVPFGGKSPQPRFSLCLWEGAAGVASLSARWATSLFLPSNGRFPVQFNKISLLISEKQYLF